MIKPKNFHHGNPAFDSMENRIIIRKYRAGGRKMTYLHETWFDTHEVISRGWVDNSDRCFLETPPRRGKHLIILNARNEDGWIPNCLLISAKNIASGKADYHCDMDAALFEKWFSEQLIPNLPTKSVIVVDNASYHSRQLDKVPTKSSRKTDMLDYMARKGLPIPEKATRPELFTIIKENNNGKVYFIDDLAAKYGHTVLRLPPNYCVLNPIEKVWSQLKHKIRKVNNTPNLGESVLPATRESVDEIDSVLWSACIRHFIDVENSYLRNTEVPQLIINLNDEDEDDQEFFEEIEKELEKN
jgi:transposase